MGRERLAALLLLRECSCQTRGALTPQSVITWSIDPASIASSTSTAAAGYNQPAGVAFSSRGLFAVDRHAVHRVGAGRIAGSGEHGLVDVPADAAPADAAPADVQPPSGDDARFFNPGAIVVDDSVAKADPLLYVADTSNHAVRMVSVTGEVETLWAGLGYASAEWAHIVRNGVATRVSNAQVPLPSGLFHPEGIAIWRSERQVGGPTLLIADTDNHRILMLSRDDQVADEALDADLPRPAPPPPSLPPDAIAVEDPCLHFGEANLTSPLNSTDALGVNGSNASGIVCPTAAETSTANGTTGGNGAGGNGTDAADGDASSAVDSTSRRRLQCVKMRGIESCLPGVEWLDGRVHRWTLRTFAGGSGPGLVDSHANEAQFRQPRGIAVCHLDDGTVEVLVADTGNHVIRRIRAGGDARSPDWKERVVETFVGTGAPGGLDTRTEYQKPKASVLLTSLLSAEFALPRGISCDGRGGALVGDTGNGRVRHVSSGGVTSTIAFGMGAPTGLSVEDGGEVVYVADSANGKVMRIQYNEPRIQSAASPRRMGTRLVAGAIALATSVALRFMRSPR